MSCFQTFWHGSELPRHVKLCMMSFVARGHRYKLYAYHKHDVPSGVDLVDAATILPEFGGFPL